MAAHAFAQWFVYQFALKNPSVSVGGLYHRAGRYMLIARSDAAAGGSPLRDRVRESKPIGLAVDVAETAPDGWELVPDQDLEAFLHPPAGLKSLRSLFTDLSVRLPKTFPDFNLVETGTGIAIEVERALSGAERAALDAAVVTLQIVPPPLVEVADAFVPSPFKRRPSGDISLLPARRLPEAASRRLRQHMEDDEDLWSALRGPLFRGDVRGTKDILPPSWRTKRSRCIVPTSVFPARNLRNYLSLYREVVLALPLESKMDEVVASLRCSSSDLIELMARGRVRLLLPQPIDRYDLMFLSRAAEVAPDALLLSRRLAAATVADSRERLPLLYPPLDPRERVALVRMLHRAGVTQGAGSPAQKLLMAAAAELGRIYADAEAHVDDRGALMTGSLGVGALVARTFEAARGQNLFLEFTSAASAVEWAAVLDAAVFPVDVDTYSEVRATEIVASVYSGVGADAAQPIASALLEVLPGLLTVDNDAPVRDVADAFSGSDVDRLRTLVERMSNVDDAEARASAIDEFNREVRDYERSVERTGALDIVSLGGVLGPLLLPGPEKYVGLGTWLLQRLLAAHSLKTVENETLGRLLDRLNAPVKGSSDVVLVSRLKKRGGG